MMQFRDRNNAAQMLMPYLNKYRNENGVVFAIPRGGVPIGYQVAKSFNWPLELLMTKKIGHPGHPEFAIGAVSLEDQIVDDHPGVPDWYITNEINRIRASLKVRYKLFMGDHKPVDPENKILIIIDDGVATGNTILSAIELLKNRKPKKIVVAVPVSSKEAAEKIKQKVDDFICLNMPDPFFGVGFHYRDFTQVNDDEVIRLIREVNHFKDVA